jgi:hypothetical protein
MAYTTINDPSAHFQTATWTGDGNATKAITNDGNSNLQPDWVWLKNRTDAENHTLADTTRGVTKRLISNSTAAEDTNGIASVQSDGFTVQLSYNGNTNAKDYVGWQWKANGGTTSTNNDGSQASTVQVNSTAGFSIVKRTGTGSAGATYGHGLGVVPDVIINKGYNVNNWYCYFKAIGGGTKWIMLDGDGAAVTDANMWNDTDATSSVFTVGNSGGSNGNGVDYIAYCFASVKGYSKFGSYKGNGNADGTFVYTGFKPAWLMIKRTSGTNHWHMFDDKRDPDNVVQKHLLADLNNAEASNTWGDLLSNGFKLRTTLVGVNGSGDDYVYMAFAQNPFVATNNVAATAR